MVKRDTSEAYNQTHSMITPLMVDSGNFLHTQRAFLRFVVVALKRANVTDHKVPNGSFNFETLLGRLISFCVSLPFYRVFSCREHMIWYNFL